MAKRKITLNIPVELISNLQSLGVSNVTEFLENLFNDIEAEDLLALAEDESFWDEEDVDFEEEEEDY